MYSIPVGCRLLLQIIQARLAGEWFKNVRVIDQQLRQAAAELIRLPAAAEWADPDGAELERLLIEITNLVDTRCSTFDVTAQYDWDPPIILGN